MNSLLPDHAEHFLNDGRGQVWSFLVHRVVGTVIVKSPVIVTGEPCSMIYSRKFLRDTLAQLPQDAVMRMFAEARLFTNYYPTVVKPYEHNDGMSNTFEVGIRIRFTRDHPSVVMERGDARRLWELLRTAR